MAARARPVLVAWLVLCAATFVGLARAHEFKLDMVINAFVRPQAGELQLVVRAPLYLFKAAKFPVAGEQVQIDQAAPAIQRALAALQHDVQLFEDGRPLVAGSAGARLSLPSDRSFESYEQALGHVNQALEPGTTIYADQGYVDALITYPIRSAASEFTVRTTAGPELGVALKLALRFLPPEGAERALVITSGSGTVALNPGWLRAAGGFTRLGVVHILGGWDHLLFLLCLMIPLRGWRQVLSAVTVFTVAHSFTLLGSAFGLAPSGAWFPPFVETAIAASIVWMALENIVGVRLDRRLLLTGLFGMVHGFGFSYGLQENFQFAGTHLLVSLCAFNVGIEAGQLLVLALMLPLLAWLRRHLLAGRAGVIVLSALIAHTAWHWMGERADALWRVPWPAPSGAALATLGFWLAGMLLAGAAMSLATRRLGLKSDTPQGQGAPAD